VEADWSGQEGRGSRSVSCSGSGRSRLSRTCIPLPGFKAMPDVRAEPRPVAEILPRRDRGNVIAATGVALLDMVARQG
jgi:hypothetical protein